MQFPIGMDTAAPGVLCLALLCLPLASGCRAVSDPPDPPSGGKTYTYPLFEWTVAPVLTRQGCDAGGDCRGGGIRGSLELSPLGDKDPVFHFEQVARAMRREMRNYRFSSGDDTSRRSNSNFEFVPGLSFLR